MTTIYVSNDGNDSTGAGTAENPFRTLDVALANALTGYTIWVLPKKQGSTSFNEPLLINTPFHINKAITLRGTAYGTSIIQFNGLSTNAAIYIEMDNLVFSNISLYTNTNTVVEFDSGSDGTTTPLVPDNITFDTCKLTYGISGILMYTSNVVRVRNCIFEPKSSNVENSCVVLGRTSIYTEISGCSSVTYNPWYLLTLGVAHASGTVHEFECFQMTGQLIVRNNTITTLRTGILLNQYAGIFTPDTTNLLYLNVCGNTFSGTNFVNCISPSSGSHLLEIFGLIAFYLNTATNTTFNGVLYLTGDYSSTYTVNGKAIFDSNVIPADSGSIYNYNAEPFITADSLNKTVVFTTSANYIETSYKTSYPFIEDPLIFSSILPYLVVGTFYRNKYSSIVLCQQGTVSSTSSGVTMTLSNPNKIYSYFIGIDTTLSDVHGSTSIFKFFISEYTDAYVLNTTVSQNLTFTFTSSIPEKVYKYYLFTYNELLDDYVNTWNIMTKSSNTVYTVTLTSDSQYAVAEIGGLGSDFGTSNISGKNILGTSLAVEGTVGATNIVINNANGMTDLGKTKINSTTAIKMTNNNSFSLAVAGSAYLSTGTVWTTASDERIKKNIKKVDPDKVTDLLSKLNVYEYEYDKRYQDDCGKKRIGILAQDIEKIEPNEYVSMVKNYGNLKLGKDSIENFKTVDHSNLIFYLLVATQKLLGKQQ
jgi:hypothetical protein